MQRMSVLLPLPLGPHTTTTSPPLTFRFMLLRTWSEPNHLSTLRNSITARRLIFNRQDCKISDGILYEQGLFATAQTHPLKNISPGQTAFCRGGKFSIKGKYSARNRDRGLV